MSTGEPGPGVDSKGQPVVDPTQNVLDLVEAAIQRQDDLRVSYNDSIRREMELRARHAEQLREIETARLDAIRAVDVGAVQRAAEVQATQAGALAAQVVATADAFRVSLSAALEPIQKDIRDLRDAQSRTVGGRDQSGDTRLNIGALLGGMSVLLVLVFGVAAIVLR